MNDETNANGKNSTGMAIPRITPNSAVLNWDVHHPNLATVVVILNASNEEVQRDTVSGTTCTVANLKQGTSFQWLVYQTDTTHNTPVSVTIPFATECVTIAPDYTCGFEMEDGWEFIPNQWAVFNPLVWALMIWLGIRSVRTGDVFRRTLSWTILGFQVFFFLMSFRGHVEPHWTVVTSIPAIIMLIDAWPEFSVRGRKALTWTLGVFAGLLLIARIVLMLNILPVQTGLAGKQAQCEAIHAQAKGLPVVFDGSFQMPSLYRFFYDDQAVLVRNQYDRYTQYDLLHLERGLIGGPACVHRFGQVYITDHLGEEDLHE